MDEEEQTGGRSRALDHGVDSISSPPAVPISPMISQASRTPRVGFFGSIRDHLVDLDLLEAVARALPEASWCWSDRSRARRSGWPLHALPNVHFLGPKSHEEIPEYGRGFDVALMPWNDNEWIHHANPIKMKEYLALGLPVVSTDFPEVHRYSDLIRIAGDEAGFVAAVSSTLADGGLGTPEFATSGGRPRDLGRCRWSPPA